MLHVKILFFLRPLYFSGVIKFLSTVIINLLSIFIPSTLVSSASGVGTLFGTVPSFAKFNARVLLSDIAAAASLHASKMVNSGRFIWQKSKVEVLLI